MMRRRRKTSVLRSLPIWACALALITWGLWQAELLRRTVLAETARSIQLRGSQDDTGPAGTPGERSANATDGAVSSVSNLTETLKLISLPDDISESVLLPTPTFDSSLTADELFKQGTALLDSGQIVTGRFALNAALARTQDDSLADQLRTILTSLNAPVFMGTAVLADDPSVRFIEVQSGDTFGSLGRTYGTPADFLQRANPTLNPNNLKLFTGIKIVQGPFHLRIVKHLGRMDVYARDIYVASCAVDFPEGNSLPKGDYQITAGNKLQLGSRTWIGFEGREPATEEVGSGWLFASAGPRGNALKDRVTGIHLADADLQQLYIVLAEGRSRLHVDP